MRKLRVEYPGAIDHVMNRGDRREAIFQDENDRQLFWDTLGLAEMKKRGWKEGELERRRKGDAGKVKIARRVRAETTMTLAWIARRLRMGTRTHVAHLLYWLT